MSSSRRTPLRDGVSVAQDLYLGKYETLTCTERRYGAFRGSDMVFEMICSPIYWRIMRGKRFFSLGAARYAGLAAFVSTKNLPGICWVDVWQDM
jgi:hypothetical protein